MSVERRSWVGWSGSVWCETRTGEPLTPRHRQQVHERLLTSIFQKNRGFTLLVDFGGQTQMVVKPIAKLSEEA